MTNVDNTLNFVLPILLLKECTNTQNPIITKDNMINRTIRLFTKNFIKKAIPINDKIIANNFITHNPSNSSFTFLETKTICLKD